MRKLCWFLLFSLGLGSCTKNEAPKRKDYISRMLQEEITYLEGHKGQMEVSKTVAYSDKPVTVQDSIGSVISILKSIQDMEPGRLLQNKGFGKDSTVREADGQKLLQVDLKRLSSKESPFSIISTEQSCQGEDCSAWKSFHMERTEDNYLYSSQQNYLLSFAHGHLNSIRMQTKEKSLLSDSVKFDLQINIQPKL